MSIMYLTYAVCVLVADWHFHFFFPSGRELRTCWFSHFLGFRVYHNFFFFVYALSEKVYELFS